MIEKQHISENHDIRMTLLGTGGPTPVMERFGPSVLVEAGGEILLFDAGRGVIQRLLQLKQPVREVRSVFLTHLHSDHIVGFPDLWLTGWLNGRPEVPLMVWERQARIRTRTIPNGLPMVQRTTGQKASMTMTPTQQAGP